MASAANSWGASAVDQNHRAHNRHARRTNIDEVPSHLEGNLGTCFDNYFHPSLQMDFLAGLQSVFGAYLFILIAAHG